LVGGSEQVTEYEAAPLYRLWRSGCRGWWRLVGQLILPRGMRSIWTFCWQWRMHRESYKVI